MISSLCGGLPEAVIGLADGGPERLVVEVKHPAAMELARADRRRESPLDQRLQEVRALLAMDDAGEAAGALALDEDARVQEHVQQEPRLTFAEAERRDGFHPLGIGQVDCPAVGFRRQRHRSNSSMIPRMCCPPSAAATADPASGREIASESGLGCAASVGPAIVAGHDLKILVPRAAISVLVLDPRVRKPDVPIVVRQLVFTRANAQSLPAHSLAGRRRLSFLPRLRYVQEALIVALQFVVEDDAPNPTALAAYTLLGALVGAIDLGVVRQLARLSDAGVEGLTRLVGAVVTLVPVGLEQVTAAIRQRHGAII